MPCRPRGTLERAIPRIVEALEKGATRTAAAIAAGMTRNVFYDRLSTVDAFRERVEAAEAVAELRASRTVTDAFDDTDRRIATENARWWLERRRRSAYGPSLDLRTVPTNVLVELLTGVNDDSDEPPPSLQQLQRERERTLLLAQADASIPTVPTVPAEPDSTPTGEGTQTRRGGVP